MVASPELDGTEDTLAHCTNFVWIVVKLNLFTWTSLTLSDSAHSFIPRRRARCWLNSGSFKNFCSINSPTWQAMDNGGETCFPSKEMSNRAGCVLSLKSIPIEVTIELPFGSWSISSKPSTVTPGFYQQEMKISGEQVIKLIRTDFKNLIAWMSLLLVVLVKINSTWTIWLARRKGVRGKRYWICKPCPVMRFKQSYCRTYVSVDEDEPCNEQQGEVRRETRESSIYR